MNYWEKKKAEHRQQVKRNWQKVGLIIIIIIQGWVSWRLLFPIDL